MSAPARSHRRDERFAARRVVRPGLLLLCGACASAPAKPAPAPVVSAAPERRASQAQRAYPCGTDAAPAHARWWLERGQKLCCVGSRPEGEGWEPVDEGRCSGGVGFFAHPSSECRVAAVDVNIRLQERVAFPLGSTALDDAAQSTLRRVAEALLNTPELPPLNIVGSTRSGEQQGALGRPLASARAEVVQRALLELGVPPGALRQLGAAEYEAWHRSTVGGAGVRDPLGFPGVLLQLFQPRPPPRTCGSCPLELTARVTAPEPAALAETELRLCSPRACWSLAGSLGGFFDGAVLYASLPESRGAARIERHGEVFRIVVRGLEATDGARYRLEILHRGELVSVLSGRTEPSSSEDGGCPSLALTPEPGAGSE